MDIFENFSEDADMYKFHEDIIFLLLLGSKCLANCLWVARAIDTIFF